MGSVTGDQVFPILIRLCMGSVDKSGLIRLLIEKQRSVSINVQRTAERPLDEPDGGFEVVWTKMRLSLY